jgi:hypothetical protein
MGRIAAWWRGLSRRAKIIVAVVAVVLVLGAVASAGQTDEPVADASQTATPTATPSATPGESVAPTAVPTATPVPTPEPTPAPAFADISLSGTGDAVPRFSIPDGIAAIAEIHHTGRANFAVFSVAEDGSNNDLLVNTIGNYTGTVLFDETSGTHSVAFEVTADGAWTITVKPVTAARLWDGTSALSGSGDDVIHIDPAIEGLATFNITHNGSGNFAVFAYSDSGSDLLVNEIGAYSGESLVGSGTFLLEISADGAWTVTPS